MEDVNVILDGLGALSCSAAAERLETLQLKLNHDWLNRFRTWQRLSSVWRLETYPNLIAFAYYQRV
jgi:hypothetical protein